MKSTVLHGQRVRPFDDGPGTKRRKKKRTSRKGIVHTTRIPRWQLQLQATRKKTEKVLAKALAWVGAITLVFLLIRYWGGG